MNFSEIFKKSFLDGFTAQDINIYTAITAMLIASLLALYIFVVYRVLTRKTFYSKTFNISLAGISLITCGIALAHLYVANEGFRFFKADHIMNLPGYTYIGSVNL